MANKTRRILSKNTDFLTFFTTFPLHYILQVTDNKCNTIIAKNALKTSFGQFEGCFLPSNGMNLVIFLTKLLRFNNRQRINREKKKEGVRKNYDCEL